MAENAKLKKLFDVLFEPEDGDNNEENISNQSTRLKAEDVLYAKKNKPVGEIKEENIFIDYDLKKDETKNPIEESSVDKYEPSEQITPIFGPLGPSSINKTTNENKLNTKVSYSTTSRNSDNQIGVIISPFYGYETRTEEIKLDKEETPIEEINDFDITEDLGDIFSTDEFKQEIKEEENEEIDLFSDFYISEDK